MTLRAVIFDIGGVLWRSGDRAPHRKWETRLGLPEGGLSAAIWMGPLAEQAMVGQATSKEVWAELGKRFSLTADELEALQADYWSAVVFDDELIRFILSLKPEFKTAIISDAFLDAREAVQERLNRDTFDVMVFSSEEGVRKPDPEIFRRALSRLGVAAEEAIFVDDVPSNVRGARAMGIHAIHFTDSVAVREEIRRLIKG